MLTSLKRVIRAGFIGFWRNAFVSLSAIFVIVVTLTVVGGAMLVGQLLDTSLSQIKDKVDINVYMVTTASEDAIGDLKSSLEGRSDVRQVIYTSKEEALQDFRDRHKSDEQIVQALEELDDNPLGGFLSIRAEDTSRYESIATYLEQYQEAEQTTSPLIDRINFNKNKVAIDKLTEIINTTEQVTYIMTIILIVSSILIAFNTIRLTIYTSKEEISVMRLVGASNMFIRGPFILQGVMYGLISGVVTLLILYPVVLWLGPVTESFFSFNIFEYFVTNFGHLFFVLVGSGIVLGTVSSTFAIARYLRV
ncbi:MAG: ABC transporter permease [Candidatus Pacebacteria bacterium]|nr:ABC transporter permease [Candidatus Paceibacterota bacterium]MCF7857510.1 ABC transporter permease [Candidatus Paceibacterota bacterium]